MTKTALRVWAKTQRSQLDIASVSAGVCQHLADFLQAHQIRHILSYRAFGSEVDLEALQTLYPAHYYLPRVQGQQLYIHPLPARMVRHTYGMLEPAPEAPTVEPGVLEAVLVPGLAFDRQGYRLGYGKGFYDRFLGPLEALTIGVTPQALCLESVPTDPWDIRVGYLASEAGVRETDRVV